MNIVGLLHDITQLGYEVRFGSDFNGMISITYYEDDFDGMYYIRHEHLSFPGGNMIRLEKDMSESLSNFLEEVKVGKPEKDGLPK